jgi:pSer/pThr/pTyr-binding forkhead associated (FHA) protein
MNTTPVLAYLRVIASDGSEHTVAITQSPFCMGRGGHNDLSLVEPQVSRHHACLRQEGDQFQLVDVGSENGTWLETSRLEVNQPYPLVFYQTFRIGSYQLRLEPSPLTFSPYGLKEEAASAVAAEPAEIPVAAGSTQPSIEPLIESSSNKRLGVVLKTPQITVTPGASANVSLIVINQSQNPDGFRITLSGIPEAWLPAPPPLLELPGNARQEVNLTIHPPRSPQSQAGSHRLLIQVASQNALTETVEVWATLTLVVYIAFGSALHPPRISVNDPAQVVVRNDGNAPETFTVTWRDLEDHYEFRPAEMHMTLAAGESTAAEFRAVPRHQRLFGGARIDVYSVKIAPEGGPPQSHTGQIVTTGIFPAWAAVFFLLLVVCAVGTGAVAFARLDPTPTVTPTVTGTVTPTITGTIAAGLDSDGDGLPDTEEARLGTDPHSADTDRDGLTDYDEARRGTSPILADTDGDTWLDGQEAFGCSDPRNPDTDGDGVRDNIDPDPCRLPTPTAALPTDTPLPTWTPLPTLTPVPTSIPLPTNTPPPTSTPLPPTAVPTPTPIITDWRGEYYGNIDLQGTPIVVRNDVDVNFNWGWGAPDPVVPADNFSARWTRTLNFEGRTYRFSIQGDDGLRVFVDNTLIINEWHPAPVAPITYTADVNLTPGQHALRVEFYESQLDAFVFFRYEPAP